MITLIHTPEEYQAAMERLEAYFDTHEIGEQLDEVRLLILTIAEYEDRTVPHQPLPSPIDAIRFRMEQQGLRSKDLIPFIGSSGSVSDILHGRRPLSLRMIRKLHAGLGIPLEVLIQETTPKGERP